MDFQSLMASYAEKTDEELLQLAAESNQLTFEAQSALRGEISKRSLSFERATTKSERPISLSAIQAHDFQTSDIAKIAIPVGGFVQEVLGLYHKHRSVFLRMMFPAVLISYMAITLSLHEARVIAHQVDPSSMNSLNHTLLQVQLINLIGYAASWLVFCVAFAAICSAVEQDAAKSQVSIVDSFRPILERFAPFLRLSMLLFLLFFVLEVLSSILGIYGIGRMSRSIFGTIQGPMLFLIMLILYGAAALIVSRFALAMPAVILDDYSLTRAMFRSDELTEGRWFILAVLLFKSILGGYIAGMLPFWLARWIPDSINLPSWFPWVLTGASIAAVTVVEPIMFIGFALLYEKANCRSLDAPHESATHAACSG